MLVAGEGEEDVCFVFIALKVAALPLPPPPKWLEKIVLMVGVFTGFLPPESVLDEATEPPPPPPKTAVRAIMLCIMVTIGDGGR